MGKWQEMRVEGAMCTMLNDCSSPCWKFETHRTGIDLHCRV